MKLTSAILLATLCWAVAVRAQGPDPACSGDVQRFCADVQPGGGRIMRCLRQHAAELSQGCKDALVRMGHGGGGRARGRQSPWFKSCEADVGKFCQGVQPGGGRLITCLEGHRSELADACRAALDQRPRRGGAPASPAAPVPTAAPTPPKP